jgi:HPt (histidine-containing phosphotransfer) domain-containing protein
MVTLDELPLLDTVKLKELSRALQPKDFNMLLSLFGPQADRAIAQFEEAQSAGDPVGCRNSMHGLKGMAGNIGVVRVAEIARQMEISGNYSDMPELLQAIQDSHAALTAWQVRAD